jgi:hypothetical protein
MVIMMHATQWMAQPNGPSHPKKIFITRIHMMMLCWLFAFADSLDHFFLTSYHFYIMDVLIRQMGIFLLGY